MKYHGIILCHYIAIDVVYPLFCVFYFTAIWKSRAGIFCATINSIDEALDDTFLSFTVIYPSFCNRYAGVVTIVINSILGLVRGDIHSIE